MAAQAITLLERGAAERAKARLLELAREALPPELAHLAEGPMAEALAKAIDYAQHSISPIDLGNSGVAGCG